MTTAKTRAQFPLSGPDSLRAMLYIRRFEEACLGLSRDGEIQGSIHLCLGQEAIPVGALAGLGPDDRVLSTYRGHGWALACGTDPRALMAEIAQRAEGINAGRCGSPLLSDPSSSFLGENSIVGAGAPIAAGVALAARDQAGVVLTSFGDGAMNQGSVTEAMVFAAAKDLPVIFLCENNGWSEMTPIGPMTRQLPLVNRASALGITAHVVDGNDPTAVAAAVRAAAEQCRAGAGPVFLECMTHRLSGHYNRDIEHYRSAEDKAEAQSQDPLARLAGALISSGAITETDFTALDHEVTEEVEALAALVRALPAPEPSDVLDHVYADPRPEQRAEITTEARVEMTYQRAVNSALRRALSTRPEVLVYGEDVGFAGGIFGVSRGLQKEFGADRVFDTPIAEAAILGSAVGASLAGLRPVVEIMWADFVFVALDQIVNQAANVRYINQSRLSAPLTIRMQQGVTPGSCAQHAQSIEAILAHIPGIKVGLPATPQDAYDMTLAAIDDDDPTVLIEFRSLYQETAEVAVGGAVQSVGGARRYGTGRDIAIITWGSMLDKALVAAQALHADGVDVSVLDLRWVSPIDDAAIDAVVRECEGRVVVAHEANLTGGFGAEIAARITERHFETLVAPVCRVGTPDLRMPASPSLQAAVLPSSQAIAAACRLLTQTTA